MLVASSVSWGIGHLGKRESLQSSIQTNLLRTSRGADPFKLSSSVSRVAGDRVVVATVTVCLLLSAGPPWWTCGSRWVFVMGTGRLLWRREIEMRMGMVRSLIMGLAMLGWTFKEQNASDVGVAVDSRKYY